MSVNVKTAKVGKAGKGSVDFLLLYATTMVETRGEPGTNVLPVVL